MNDSESPLNSALRLFEAAEANLKKLERLWKEIVGLTPDGIEFASNEKYENKCRTYSSILAQLPKIDRWKPQAQPLDLDAIAQARLDAQEVGEAEAFVAIERHIEEPGRELREYRFKLDRKRRELVREALFGLMAEAEQNILAVQESLRPEADSNELINCDAWSRLKVNVEEMDTLLGSSPRPDRWVDLRRHLSFGEVHDYFDIKNEDWPSIKRSLHKSIYDENEPVPMEVEDLGTVVATRPHGHVAVRLKWDKLSAKEFERLIFALIVSEDGYENPEWLMATDAADRGRDLSVVRVIDDPLAGTIRLRVIIQCKHWLTHSISMDELSKLKEQMKLWEPPRVDVCIVATSGRFTADAVAYIEKHNQSDSALRIEMWPESHLEMLLAERPALIAEFNLR